jgi:hypothetical protein
VKIKNYKIINKDFVIFGKGKTFRLDKLKTLFDENELQKLKDDFTNDKIDNYLINSWEVVYYIILKKENGKVLTFSVFEYDKVNDLLL